VGGVTEPSRPSVVRAAERVPAAGLPKGVIGEQAFHHDQGWVGFLRLEPGASSPWHHHGEWDSYAYVFAGVLRWEHGPAGRDATEVPAGGVGHMPAWRIHRDVSAGDEDLEMVLFRAGHGRLTMDVPGPEESRPETPTEDQG
jgi:quercetin dioxygenase-like cupin family protein